MHLITVPIEFVIVSPNTTQIAVIEKTDSELECVTSPGKPGAIVNWFIEYATREVQTIETGIKNSVNTSNLLTVVSSFLRFRVSRADQGKEIFCGASNFNRSNVKSRKLLLNILCKCY